MRSATLHTLGLAELEPGLAAAAQIGAIAQTLDTRQCLAVCTRTNVGNTLLFVTTGLPSCIATCQLTPG